MEPPAPPAAVAAAAERAHRLGFELSCEPAVGALLASLAAAVPRGGRVLELGTGTGYGLGWIVHGLDGRDDAEVVTVDIDPGLQDEVCRWGWPAWVRFEVGDGAELVGRLGRFDLVFADAPGGKITGLRHTVAALAAGGVLVVDDMDLSLHGDPELRDSLARVSHQLAGDPDLVVSELPFASGVVLATRRW